MDRFLRDPAHPGSDSDVDVESRNCINPQTLEEISTIMELPSSSLINDNFVSPNYPGAVLVTRYRDGPPKISSEPSQNNAAQSAMQTSDVKQRAAWAWARSSELYDRCASELEQNGHTTKALNLQNVTEKSYVLENVVQTLRKRARLAKRHAEKLLSETTADSFLQWTLTGDGLSSDDVQFYERQYWNYEDVQRAEMSRLYKEAATKFFLEAFYTFIDERIEYEGTTKHMTSNQYIRERWNEADPMMAFSYIFTLWSNACKWSIPVGQNGAAVRGSFRPRQFREMMRRAVHHYAHAEWLVRELYLIENGAPSSRRKIEQWRLAPPSGVHFYVNDCGIRTGLHLCNPEGSYDIYGTAPEDDYLEWYVCTLVDHSDYRWDMYPGYGAPGAPERIYEDLATRPWPGTPLSMHVTEPPIKDLLCGTISSSSTTLEKYTALIGDRIFEEWFVLLFSERMLRKSGASLPEQLTTIKRDVQRAINHQAIYVDGTLPSPAHVCGVIEGHISRLMPELLRQGNYESVLWMYLLEWNLRLWVCPWFDIRLYKRYKQTLPGNPLSVQLLCPKTAQIVAGKPETMTTLDLLRLEQAKSLQAAYVRLRQDILERRSTNTNQMSTMLRYRAVIERGDWSDAPLIETWSLRPFRLQSPVSVYKLTLQAMYSNPEKSENWKRDLQALSTDMRKVEQEQEEMFQPNTTLKMVFDHCESLGLGRVYDVDPQIEEFSRIRNSETPHLHRIGQVEWEKSRDQGPKVKRIGAMLFPPGTAPEKLLRDSHAIYRREPQLTEAVRARDEEEVRQLLESGADIDVMNDAGITPLQIAASFGYKEIVRVLLEYKPDMGVELLVKEDAGYIPCTVLHTAVVREDADIVELLLRNGAKVDERALEEGVFKANVTIFQNLLDHGPNLAARYGQDRTILHTAAAKGSVGILSMLINKGAEIDARDVQGNTPLHVAAAYNHQTIVQLLLNAGANIEAIDHQHLTALAIAIKSKGTAVIRTLLDNNANIEAHDERSLPVLILAAREKDESLVRLLLEGGADANVLCLVTPLHLAASDNQPTLLELLLSYGAQVESRSTCYESPPDLCQTPLHFAVNFGHISAAKVLLKWGADVNAKFHDGVTPLHLAAQMGHLDMVSFLLLHGANITAETEKTDTPFSVAAASGHGSIAELLLEKGRAVMTANQRARGLVMAVTSGSTSLVATLLDRGIPVDAIDGQGRTALSMARSMSHGQMVNFLTGRSANTSARNDAAHVSRPTEVASTRGHSKGAGLFRRFRQRLRRNWE